MKLTHSLLPGNKNFVRDLIGILLALGLGIIGQIFVLNPLSILSPGIPVLSHQDWAGSRATSGLTDASGSDIDKRKKKREFHIRLQSGQLHVSNRGAEIWHRAVWYADSTEAIAAWTRHDSRQGRKFFNNVPLATTPLGRNMPASVLYCDELSDRGRVCAYFAYWEHWYTEVWFWSDGDEYLSFAEMQSIMAYVDQLLLAAPDQP